MNPSLSGRSLALLAVFLLAFAAGWSLPIGEPDLGWHLLGGQWIAQHRNVPIDDFINSRTLWWNDYHWLFQIVAFWIVDLGGFVALQVCAGILCGLLGAGIFVLASSATKNPLPALLAATAAWAMIEEVLGIRPQLLSAVILTAIFYLLRRPSTSFELPLTLGFALLLANIHVFWIFIPILWFAFRCLPGSRARFALSPMYGWIGLVLLSLCGFFNPYTFIGAPSSPLISYALLYDYAVQPEALRQSIGELRSLFTVGGLDPLLFVAAMVLIARSITREKFKKYQAEYFILILGTVLALRGYKYIALFAVLSVPLVALAIEDVLEELRWARPQVFTAVLAIVLIGAAGRIVFKNPWTMPESRDLSWLPQTACTAIPGLNLTPRRDRKHLRVMTHFNQGAWCRYFAYQADPNFDMRVTTDARTQWVRPEDIQRANELYQLKPGWYGTIQQWAPDLILTLRDQALEQILSQFPSNFKVAYSDKQYRLYIPQYNAPPQ